MSQLQLQSLHAAVAVACPIHGVSVGDLANKATWRVDFKTEATQNQRTAAQGVIDGFDAATLNEPPAAATTADFETVCQNALTNGDSRVDLRRLLKAKFISDLAWRLGVAPGSLTNAQLLAERDRIANIYKNL